MIKRELYHIIYEKLFKGKAIILTGPRQTGKTTLVKAILKEFPDESLFLNADEPDVRAQLEEASSTTLRNIIGDRKIIAIDEAQRISNIGITLKLITDEIKNVQLIVTGSSSLGLADKIHEPLTGRKFEYHLHPLSYSELVKNTGYLEERRQLESRLIYGSYPDVVNNPSEEREILTNLTDTFLYSDILSLDEVRKPEMLTDLLEALALQVGSQVRYSEVGDLIGASQKTVKKYIELLEKVFVIFRLRAFNRNVRNEIKRSRKIYFYDNGIRNAILRNYNPLHLRTDIGALWENYLISERKKRNAYMRYYAKSWFWRTRQQQEIDYIEEIDGVLSAFEFKWSPKRKTSWSKTFTGNYTVQGLTTVHRDNYSDFLQI
ncbi:MAG: ATPase [Bacteroidetes bacterium]|nr:MAG: ATPase [Bacteroidota bacterium]